MSEPTWEYFQDRGNRDRALAEMTDETAADVLDLAALYASPDGDDQE